MPKEMSFQTLSEKIVAGLWLLVLASVFSITIYGWKIGDAWGGLLISCLPASLWASAAALIVNLNRSHLMQATKMIWIAVTVSALIGTIGFSTQGSGSIRGAETILAYVLLILAFPISIIVPIAFMFIDLSGPDSESLLTLIYMWLAFNVAGYMQWFIFLPKLIERQSANRSSRHP